MQQHPSYSTVQDQIYPTKREEQLADERKGRRSQSRKNNINNYHGIDGSSTTATTSSFRDQGLVEANKDDIPLDFMTRFGRRYGDRSVVLQANLTRVRDRFPSFSFVVGADLLSNDYPFHAAYASPPFGHMTGYDDVDSRDAIDIEIENVDVNFDDKERNDGPEELFDLSGHRESLRDRSQLLGSYLPFVLQ